METLFTARLKELRKEKALSQKALAKIIGTTDDSIYSWERGRSQPSIEYIKLLCNALETSADYLLGICDE